jgi:alcohol dehydrogenase (cytochrome c)
MLRSTLLAALVSVALPMTTLAQTADELKNDEKTPGDVLTYGMGYGHQRFSPLTQINRDNVKRLVPAWTYSMADNNGQQSHALIKDGVMYITDHAKTVALDALTGKQIWKSTIEYPPETTRIVCCGIVNRGSALLDGTLFRTTLDASVIALDIKTGKELWRTKSADPKDGFSMTVAPLVANGVVIAGVAGAEYGHRGYLEGYDPQTGKVLWRTWTIPEPGQKGSDTWPANDSWKTGGGSTWLTGSYDPELDLVFWGTGNPAPWNPLGRVGDNLYTNTILAVRPKTGEVVWHYQTSPGDPFDYDGVNELVQAELPVNGTNRKVIMQAHRNGFFYVLERATGKLVAANKFVKVNWADGVDLETGRPVWSAETKSVFEKGAGHKVRIGPPWSAARTGRPCPTARRRVSPM